ncbi:maleylpyruvate isomerase family mycothiol-dependent enzyme [Streptomyces sp. NBC_01262]|uniref:maleylpyruvate isomerase family mycothiol-dependent enzyme n=1 Tax=Streptomyces sp. NBC_01262 TaxID=2903803 RepID=UPI002E380ABF|nr:maleylpyruvate isomerase family mycothiol-dependent enzyme [Streptomyces sp. NBC_01262]
MTAHVAANADALGNLVQWAATGTPTPMYASAEERAAGITEGSRQPGSRLLDWLRLSAHALEEAMDRLDETQWNAKVVTAQGRTVPATEIPWMRAREVCVHAVDLDNGVTFADLPADFLAALCDDIVAKRGGAPGPDVVIKATDTAAQWHLPGLNAPVGPVTGPLAQITAYLAGRDHSATTTAGAAVPELPAWL